jgi:hypothetical protein
MSDDLQLNLAHLEFQFITLAQPDGDEIVDGHILSPLAYILKLKFLKKTDDLTLRSMFAHQHVKVSSKCSISFDVFSKFQLQQAPTVEVTK